MKLKRRRTLLGLALSSVAAAGVWFGFRTSLVQAQARETLTMGISPNCSPYEYDGTCSG
ncbi:MAG: hypothetical protein ACUVRV_11935 [Cyanobacteriota bacterium]